MRTGVPLPAYTAVITFDDGYENNATVAFPCLREGGMSAAFFLSTAYIGTSECLWVDQLEQILNDKGRNRVFVRFGLTRETMELKTDEERREAHRLIRWFCKQLPDAEKKTWLQAFFNENGIVPPKAEGEHRFMTWDQVGELHAGGMSIGPHTMTHAIVTRLTAAEMEREIAGSIPERTSGRF
jgi:peptidoglycan/xylan/chitin deacetylase (PgdA/CDA1 family)